VRPRINAWWRFAAAMIGSLNLNEKHGCRVTHLSPEVLARFNASSWPGNIRELRNVLERAIIVAGEGEIQVRHLPGVFAPEAPQSVTPQAPRVDFADDALALRVGAPLSEIEEAYIRLALKHTDNKRRAAKILGIFLRTLHSKLRSYESRNSKAASAT
jgi:DNA-binding NtrC family response regulator